METHGSTHSHLHALPEQTECADVIIIGGGVVGCAMARRFTLEGARVVLLEKGPDILDGASKANSAILHTGFDAPEGSLELECVQAGYNEYHEICDSMGLELERCGALVVAWTEEEAAGLEAIRDKAHRNGVNDVALLSAAEVRAREPGLSQRVVAGVAVPGESIIDPWSAPYVYLEQAVANGARAFTSCEVTGGSFEGTHWCLETSRGPIRGKTVINCAGLYGDVVERAVTGSSHFTIIPRKGQFVVFDKAASRLVNAVILPVPTERTKGIVLFRTVFGNLAVGPTAEDQQSRDDASTDTETLQALIDDGIAKLPALKDMPVTAVYAGLRPASEEKDFRIRADGATGWITVGGIRSTGLSASLGIARHVFALYREMGHSHRAIADPARPRPRNLAERHKRDWQKEGHGEIVCHCELVTRREIAAALEGPLAAHSLAGLKRQTRVTMGRCQGFFCSARLAELTQRHFDIPMAEALDHD